VIAYFMTCQHVSAETAGNHERPQYVEPIFGPTFEAETNNRSTWTFSDFMSLKKRIYIQFSKLEIYHCHYAITGYHGDKLWSVNTLHIRKLCSRPRNNEQSFASIKEVKGDEIATTFSTHGEKGNACKFPVGKPEGKRPLGRPRRRCEDNINIVARMWRLL
jgi:hypothetical protein